MALESSVVATTRASYNSATRKWMEFWEARDTSPFPADGVMMSAWILVLAMSINVSSLGMYTAGVRYSQELEGFQWTIAGNDLVRRTMRFVKRRYPSTQATPKFPVTFSVVQAFLPFVPGWPEASTMTHDDRVCIAATLVGLAGFLRGGEFLWSRGSARETLRSSDVVTGRIDGHQVVQVRVAQPKARWWLEGEKVICYGSPTAAFNVAERCISYRRLSTVNLTPDGPAFRVADGSALSRDVLVRWTLRLLVKANVRFRSVSGAPMEVRAASWRAGGVMTALAAGASDSFIMAQGRWRSVAWTRYVVPTSWDMQRSSAAMWIVGSGSEPTPVVATEVGNSLTDILERMEVDEVAVPAAVDALLAPTVQRKERPRPVSVLEPTYEVESLLDRRTVPGNRLEYLVQWKGYSDPSWVPAGNVQGRRVKRDLKRRLEEANGMSARRVAD